MIRLKLEGTFKIGDSYDEEIEINEGLSKTKGISILNHSINDHNSAVRVV